MKHSLFASQRPALCLTALALLTLVASLITPGKSQTALPVGPTNWALSGANLYNTNSGNVGVGTSSPSRKLTVFTGPGGYGLAHTDGTRLLSTYVSSSGGWLGTVSADPLNFYTADSGAQMTLTTAGNVGIGTASPGARLHVLTGGATGISASGVTYGVYALSSDQFVPACGVHGGNTYYGNYGRLGTTGEGVYGWGNNNGIGVEGETVAGTGVDGTGYNGVWGTSPVANGNGVKGEAHNGSNAYGVWGYSTSGWAGTFSGKVQVTGNFYGGAKFFKIDHPLDPENKYLIHACVESDEMKNVYDGEATLDGNGEAWVSLPPYFEALNKDFRYQLTCIGGSAPVYVARRISGDRFQIAGGRPGMAVSWQVTGVRQDAYARANPMQTEVEKEGAERGKYLHPAAFGQPETKNVEYEKLHVAKPGATTPEGK